MTWHDPFKKPAYLFAMVAGDLECIEDSFTTFNDREIPLQIFVEPENIDKCEHAMLSLKNAMRWDEEVYGREYDLDKFMIVAVNDFNMGAMENKGLNIFNSSCVLAKPETATDGAYERIEGVVAHEYFHNWSGNRVTCRDWFQLSLKEGFTVFRDQEFSADMGSRTVKRIDDVNLLRTLQFAEDAGPMAHPVRPEAYMEISNFYTVTIYEKGAEVVRMIHTLLGAELFRAGSDLYFERHDGQAVTTEDFVQAMQDASGIDLTQFKRWYGQAGTPQLTVTDEYDAGEKVYRLTVKQSTPDTPGQTDKLPLHIPFSLGLLNAEGEEVYSHVLDVLDAEHTFVFADMPEKPVPSLLRGFSAPVKLTYDYSREELMFLMKHDTDGFNRWDAGQKLSIAVIQDNIAAYQRGEALSMDQRLVDALRALLSDTALDKAMVARMLMMPSEAYLGELAEPMDIEAIHKARQFVRQQIAMALREELFDCYQQNLSSDDYRPDADEIARRSMKNICLSYLMLLGEEGILTLCATQFNDSNNMTDTNAALTALVHSSFDEAYDEVKNTALESFYSEWKHDPLVVDQWFAVQAGDPSENVFERVKALMAHEAFDINNPNKVRSLIGVFCNQNRVNFHRADGAGYAFLADRVIELDRKNPQIAARLLTPLTRWRKLTADRSELMQKELQRIKGQPELSKDVLEVVTKSL
ncbi:Membrane alanine aminopeptidase N [gamma proteobacterium IMCC2047]|nr:Membrane alanine aminopeptidase N [gamma proteobacterium IMCC2047]